MMLQMSDRITETQHCFFFFAFPFSTYNQFGKNLRRDRVGDEEKMFTFLSSID